MNIYDFIQIIVFVAALMGLTPLLGAFMFRVFEGQRTWLTPALQPLERLVYRLSGIDQREEMSARGYAAALLLFNIWGLVITFCLQAAQRALPLNPQALPGVSWSLALNTAVSFVTNTNWQSYSGETTMSYLTQMLGLTVQNFVSAATGFAVFLALARGLVRRSSGSVGNFWVDLVRATLYVLLPMSFALALVLVGQGVVQTFAPSVEFKTLEGATQTIPLGPAASQVAIKQLGTNGGGVFNVNSAHPLENPTPFSNWLEMLAILLLPAALTYTFGRLVRAPRQGWVLFLVMLSVWLAGFGLAWWAEAGLTSPALMEGKEARFGVMNSVLWASATSAASNGSVNAMHSSLSPLAGAVALFNMMMGEVIFGGVGAGLYGMLLFVLLTVFLSGLMVGRSPEYLGKKIEAAEIQMAVLGILAPCAVILLGTALACVLPAALASVSSKGPHGFTEILYAFTSAAGNNGSAFAGLNANTPFWNVALALAMLVGRFAIILPALAIAGRLAAKKVTPPSAGTFATDTPIFAGLLVGVIVIVGALTFLPALALGPIVEHVLLLRGQTF